jgi:PIN domain nuclease of toxin-antitoxin system
MRLLFDTHAFMWWDSQSSRLSPRALTACSDPSNELLLSTASVWEIQIKSQLGKLALRAPLADIIAQQRANGVAVLAISLEHVLAIGKLPSIHRDPFDRILAAQANEEGAWLVSNDPIMPKYPVKLLW